MAGSPLSRKCKTKGSICSEVKENQLEGTLPTSVLSVGRSSKKDAQILKKNSSHALSTKALCGTETRSTRELSSAGTKNSSSFSSPTISSSKKTYLEKQKVQVQQIKPRLKEDAESETTKTRQVKNIPAPRRPPLPVPKKIKKLSTQPQVLKEITPIQTSIHQSSETARHTKTQGKTPVLQSKSQKAQTSQLPQKRILNQNSVRQSEPSKQYVRRSGTQKTSIPPQALAGKTRISTSIGESKSSTSTKEPSRFREKYLGPEEPEPIYHIAWEGPEETFHSSEITCPLCENDLSDMPDEYEDEYYDDIEPSVFQSVAILPCGHSFHTKCLEGITPEENSIDPPCFFCLSCMS